MTKIKKLARGMWDAWLEVWGLNVIFYKNVWRTIQGWPRGIERWWKNLLNREYMRRTRRIHELHVWVRGENESPSAWIHHYFQDPDFCYGGLTKSEADQLGDEMIADARNLGLQLQVRSEVNRKYV